MTSRRYPDTSHVRLRTLKSTFTAEGALCAATLYVPQDARPDQELPAILMLGGWGSIQRAMTSSFTHSFVEAGFAVMEFDYPGWGDSGGFPRQGINPWRRTRVADTALAHLKSQPMVAAHQITLWGTSFGGGHVVDLATQHPELKGAIIQVPMLDGLAATLATPPDKLSAVSKDSASRVLTSSRTLMRSITTSMVCFLCKSSVGGSDKSQTSPSIRARI